MLREDKALAQQFLGSHAGVDPIRRAIERSSIPGPKVPTSADMPLTLECKRVLAYAHEESELLNCRYVDTAHLLLGLLREAGSLARGFCANRG